MAEDALVARGTCASQRGMQLVERGCVMGALDDTAVGIARNNLGDLNRDARGAI